VKALDISEYNTIDPGKDKNV